MDTEQCLTYSECNQPLGNSTEGWKSSSSSSSAPTDINSSGGFDCNICLDTGQDPVVTICGHLFCWPCIYKWIHQQSISSETPSGHQPNCPVCKSEISEKTLIPLYGRGQSLTASDKKAANLGLVDIPDRPRRPPCGVHTLIATSTTSSQHLTQHDAHHYHDYPNSGGYGSTSAQGISLAGSTTFYPIINMFGEMIYTRLFGNSQSFSTCPISYGMASVGSARARRHTLNADQSLSRLSFFLCCCLVLCLLLF